MKLTSAQRNVMEYLRHGHVARRTYLSVIEINGRKVCTEATMQALERQGLVQRSGADEDEWIATEAGARVR